MATLSVNIDHIATLRQARGGTEPDPVAAAVLCELAGAHGITCHLREDRRHIQDRDLELLKAVVKTRLNLEMAPLGDMVRIALAHKPHQVTLVPEKRQELTTEGGLNAVALGSDLGNVVSQLQEGGILVSLFIEPDLGQIKAAAKIRADYVELHTGTYANAKGDAKNEELDRIRNAAMAADKLGLGVNAGHGLNYGNTGFIAEIDIVEELNIGHSIISRAVMSGLDRAVRDMMKVIRQA